MSSEAPTASLATEQKTGNGVQVAVLSGGKEVGTVFVRAGDKNVGPNGLQVLVRGDDPAEPATSVFGTSDVEDMSVKAPKKPRKGLSMLFGFAMGIGSAYVVHYYTEKKSLDTPIHIDVTKDDAPAPGQ